MREQPEIQDEIGRAVAQLVYALQEARTEHVMYYRGVLETFLWLTEPDLSDDQIKQKIEEMIAEYKQYISNNR